MLAELEWEEGTWLMFTDDNDLWLKTSLEVYEGMLRESKAAGWEPAYTVTKMTRMVGGL